MNNKIIKILTITTLFSINLLSMEVNPREIMEQVDSRNEGQSLKENMTMILID